MTKVAVYDWIMDGQSIGCGTAVERDHWIEVGIYTADLKLGNIIGYEPSSKDEKRLAAWKRAA